ncbi:MULTISPECIES: hypothetical protein [unclassified Ruegeria]|uniref:hypothetical protein n=1 Tax=unclassified Ruegeria TaxID=2625375 RepID=UPI00149158CE|nr:MULTISPECIES: hypothetical protein [unclassified Ruegeria]NOD87417.1 hypothetical protein [Ruegeria sp. HKCCD4318]NOE12972.1 hypothetical protein [Ruegeria sp. HKCCD4318-2]
MPSRIMHDMPHAIRAKLVREAALFRLAGHDSQTAKEMARTKVRAFYETRGKDFVRDHPTWRDLFRKTAAKQLGSLDL